MYRGYSIATIHLSYTSFTVICDHYVHVFVRAGSPDGWIQALTPNNVVSQAVLKEISSWLSEGCSMDDIIVHLRKQTVPSGYSYHPWITGTYLFHINSYISVR